MKSTITQPQVPSTRQTLTITEYRWLQDKKLHLAEMEMDIARLQYQKQVQDDWIVLLGAIVFVLCVFNVALLAVILK